MWLFNANNWGNVWLQGDKLSAYVPEEFYKTAAVVRPYVKLGFDPVILVVFTVFQGGMLVLLWALWVWVAVILGRLPVVSSFPFFDFAFKPEVVMEIEKEKLWGAGDEEVLEIVDGVRVVAERGKREGLMKMSDSARSVMLHHKKLKITPYTTVGVMAILRLAVPDPAKGLFR